MRTLLTILTLALVAPATVHAEPKAPEILIDQRTGVTTAHSAVTLDSSNTSSAINVEGWSIAKVQVRYTYSAATAVTLSFEESDDGTTWSKITKTDGDDATSQFAPSWTTSAASANWTLMLEVAGMTYIRVTITSTGGDGSDVATVYVRSARGI